MAKNKKAYIDTRLDANIIYNSAWAGMHGEPIQTMKGLGYSRVVRSSYVYPYDISDELASNIVNRFCKNKEAAQVFKNINDGTQDQFGGPQENQVRKELNVPADDEEPKVCLLAYDALRAEEEQQKSNQQGKRCVLFVQDNYDDEIKNSEFDFDV